MMLLNADQVLEHGYKLVYKGIFRRNKVKRNLRRFKGHFGSMPEVYAALWNELQQTDIPEARLEDASTKDLDRFFMTLLFLKVYDTQERLASRFGIDEDTVGLWVWYYLSKISGLKSAKIKWPTNWGNVRFIISVDGVNFGINEPIHPTLNKDKKYFDRKGGKAGLTYEIALHLWENRVVWLNGPFPANAGTDKNIFNEKGLESMIPDGKSAIADKIFTGCPKISMHNSLDTQEVRVFKRRARSRQENFNGRLKNFDCLRTRFRHGKLKHQTVLEAVAVICIMQMENGSPLFDL